MRDHSHYSPDNTGFCEHCGQPLPVDALPSYGKAPVNRVGLAITVLLHLLMVLIYLLRPDVEKHAPPPSSAAVTYVLPGKPKPKEMQKQAPKPVKERKQTVVKMQRLPDTITLPEEKPVEVEEPEPPKKVTPAPPEMDMAAAIDARRRGRGQATSDQPAAESEADRGKRLALANIAAANGKSQGDDRNDTGGVFEVKKTSLSATVKFRGFNANFKRRWLQQVEVGIGLEKDIETAVIKKMIEIIRKEKTGDFEWDSHRLQRVVKLSARVEDTAELHAFLMKEMFPEDPGGRRR